MDPFTGRFAVTQSWEAHIRNTGVPGSLLGGVDFGPRLGVKEREMPRGTPLAAPSGGVLEWAEPRTKRPPAWYNTGLGYAVAVRRPDGTRTVYAHCSALAGVEGSSVREGDIIARSGGQKGSEGAGKSTGGHVHTHDVLSDGHTRARPFSTIRRGGASGVASTNPAPPEEETMLDVVVLAPVNDSARFLWYPGGTGPSRYLDGGSVDGPIAALVFRANGEKVVHVETKADAVALVALSNAVYAQRTGTLDMTAVVAAAREGASQALQGIDEGRIAELVSVAVAEDIAGVAETTADEIDQRARYRLGAG